MKVKELIKALADEDMEAEVCIEIDSEYYENQMPIEGILSLPYFKNPKGNVVLAPEDKLSRSSEFIS